MSFLDALLDLFSSAFAVFLSVFWTYLKIVWYITICDWIPIGPQEHDLKRKKAKTSTMDLDPCYVEDEMGQICGSKN